MNIIMEEINMGNFIPVAILLLVAVGVGFVVTGGNFGALFAAVPGMGAPCDPLVTPNLLCVS